MALVTESTLPSKAEDSHQLASMEDFVSHSANQFGLDFLNNLPLGAADNVAFSPWSMLNLMGMLLLGTANKSKSQLEFQRALSIPEKYANRTHEQIQSSYKRITSGLPQDGAAVNANTSVLFDQANLLLFNSLRFMVNTDYAKDLETYYKTRIEDFRPGSDPRGPLHDRVNSFVNKATRGMIKELVEPALSSSGAALVLLNAAYFKGQWMIPFEYTYKDRFFVAGRRDQVKEVDFMRREEDFRVQEFPILPPPDDLMVPNPTAQEVHRKLLTNHLNCKVLELPYAMGEGNEFGMLLLLPKSMDGVEALQRKLNATVLQAIYDSLEKNRVQVKMPKFSLETQYKPIGILRKLGIVSVFEPTTDLSRMFQTSGPLRVDDMIHKTNIKVDEKGSEAASASLAAIGYAAIPRTFDFIAHHPFLFIIRHNPSNTPLFMGRVSSF